MSSRRFFLDTTVRQVLGLRVLGLAVASGWLLPVTAMAVDWNGAAFATRSLPEVLKALGLARPPQASAQIELVAPEIAENGAVVPVSVRSLLPDTRRIALLIEHNPNLLAAQFLVLPGLAPMIGTRVKLAETGDVVAMVETGDGLYFARQTVKITIGGCGG